MAAKTQTAEQRGMEMMHVKTGDLPPLALDFMKHLAREFGLCMEVCLTAYTVYAQCVEGLPCTDDLYVARPVDIAWFDERKAVADGR